MMTERTDGIVFSLISENPAVPVAPVTVLEKGVSTVGRHPSNDITLPFESVSRMHARLELRGDEMYVVDLGSSNGTFINQQRVSEGILCDGDVLSFGNLSFVFSRRVEGRKADNPQSATRTRAGVRVISSGDTGLRSVVQKLAKSETTATRGFPSQIVDSASLDKARKLLSTIYEFHKRLGSKTEESDIYETTLNLIFEALPCERGVILVRDEETGEFQPVEVKIRGREAEEHDIAISQTIIDRCLTDRVAILSRDAMTDSRFSESQSIVLHDIRSAMCAPMMNREQVFAFCFVDTSEDAKAFGESDLAFFASLIAEVAILIDNARLRREMNRSEQMAAIGQTITGMAHNIKNILLLSQGGIGLIDACLEKKDYEAVDRTWDLVKRGLDRINIMVHEMLDFASQRPSERRVANINRIIQETIDFAATDLAEKDIELSLNLDPRIPDCVIDDQGFYKAFLNLLVNAAEAVEKGIGLIKIATKLEGDDSVKIWVEDNGLGITPTQLQKVFLPFYTTKGSKGTGLGLPMTRKIIEGMGGKIHCASSLGEGSKFEISLRPQLYDGKVTLVD